MWGAQPSGGGVEPVLLLFYRSIRALRRDQSYSVRARPSRLLIPGRAFVPIFRVNDKATTDFAMRIEPNEPVRQSTASSSRSGSAAREKNDEPKARRYSGFAELILPLMAVLACLVTVWVTMMPESRGGFKSLLRAVGLADVDLRGVEGYYDSIRRFLGTQPKVGPQVPVQDVLVASSNLRPSQVLNSDNMRWQPWPDNALDAGYITRSARPDALESLAGSTVIHWINFGEPIRDTKLGVQQEVSRAQDKASAVPAKPPVVIRGGERSPPAR